MLHTEGDYGLPCKESRCLRTAGLFCWVSNGRDEDALDIVALQASVEHGFRPDYGSGPYMLLMTAAVELARRDMSNPLYSAECRSFLTGDLVASFAECLGYEGSFLDARNE